MVVGKVGNEGERIGEDIGNYGGEILEPMEEMMEPVVLWR